MNGALLSLILALIGGALLAIQAPTNALLGKASGSPIVAALGGFYGAFFVAIAAFGAPRVSIGVLLTAAIAGQLAAALVLDLYGLLGLARHPVTVTRALGFALVLVGAALVRKS